MDKLTNPNKALPAVWFALATGILVGDYLAGPLISLSALFVIPVALASRLSGGRWGVALGVLMPLAQLSFTLLWKIPWTVTDSLINAAIRIAVLVGFAVLIDRVTRQARELRVLRGLLPVCCFCKKIRIDDQQWQPIEFYITERSEASFTHTFCPDCAQEHYGEYFDKAKPGPGVQPKIVPPPPHSM